MRRARIDSKGTVIEFLVKEAEQVRRKLVKMLRIKHCLRAVEYFLTLGPDWASVSHYERICSMFRSTDAHISIVRAF